MRSVPVIVSNYETAELVRELATASITTKISFINELATLREHVNANADAVHLVSSISVALGSYSSAHSSWTPRIFRHVP